MYFLRKFIRDVLEKRTFSVTKVMAILISVLLSINGVSTAVNNTVSTTLVAETSPSQGRTTAISVDGSTEAITLDDDTAVEPSGNSSLVTSFDVFNLTTKAVDHIDEQRDSVLSTEGPVKATSASVSTATTEGHSEGETREPGMGGGETTTSVDGSMVVLTSDGTTAVETSENPSLTIPFDELNLTTKAMDHTDEQRDSVLSTEGPVEATSASVSTATIEGHSEGETREPSMGGGETTTSVDGSMVVLTSDGTTAVETSENPSLTTPFDELNLTTKVIDHTDEERDAILSTSLSTLDGDISSTSMQGKVSQIDVTSSTENVEVTSEVMGTTSPEAEDKTVSTSVEMTDEEMSSAERTVTSSTETERITNGQEVVTGTSLTQSIENVTTPVDQTISPSKVIGPDDITVKADEVTSTLISITGKDFTTFITGDIQSVSPSAEADETTTTVDLGTTPMPGVHSGVTTIITEDGTDDFYTSVESHLSRSTQKDEIITSSEIAGTTGLPSTEDSDDFSTNATKEDTNAVTTEGELHTVTVTSKMRDIATSPITDIEDVGITTAAEQGVITSGESADEISTSVKTMDPSDTEGEGTEVMETQSIGTTEGSSSATSIQMNLKVTSPTPSPFLPSVERSLSTDSPSTLPETTLLLTTQPLHTAVFIPSVSSSSTTSSRPSASAAVQTTQTRSTEPSFTQQVTTPAEESTTTSRVSATQQVTTPAEESTTTSRVSTTQQVTTPAEEPSTTSRVSTTQQVTTPAEESTTTSRVSTTQQVTTPAEEPSTTSRVSTTQQVTTPAEESTTTSRVSTTQQVTTPAEEPSTTSRVSTTQQVTTPAEEPSTTSRVSTTQQVTTPAEEPSTTSRATQQIIIPVKTPSTTSRVSATQQVTTPAEESTTTSRVSTTLKVITKKKVPTTKVIKTTTKKMVKKVDENSLEKEKILSFYFEAKDLKKQKKRKRSDQPSNEDGDVIEIWYDEYDEKFRNNIAKVARKEAGTKDRPDADDVFYVSPTPEVRGDRFVVSVVVKSPEEVATYMEAAPLLASLKKGLQEMELEYEAFVGPAKPVREERGSGTLFDHPIILVILLLVAFLCLIIIIIGMMYLLCDKHLSSRRGEYITQYSTANDPEMSFDNPVMQEKDPANGAHLLGVRTDAEGQDIAPLECFPAEELHRNYEVEDTHL